MGAEQSSLEDFKAGADFSQNFISFTINGRDYTVKTGGCDPEIGPEYLLVDYLRDKLGLTGTKYMCREGGCGACLVTVRSTSPETGQRNVRSANSCLLPLFACDGLEITTVEGLGNRRKGYNPIQERLTKFGGTQCGFCTPGFVMNMHSVVQSNPRFTTSDVERSFDGNICRCTGFRPIIDAFKSLSVNPSENLKWQCSDIEDTYKCPLRKETPDAEKPEILNIPRKLYLQGAMGEQWFKVTTLATLYDILERFAESRIRYRLVAGNTGTGVYKNDGPYDGFIDINDVPELHFMSLDQSSLVLGGGVTLSDAIEQFDRAGDTGNFVYGKEFANHFRRVAALPVRNRGTIAGNLMLKHTHRDFISDVFVLFESVGATLTIGSSPTVSRQYTLLEFLEVDMRGKLILAVHLPELSGMYFYRCYKLGRRHQNAAAFVNCGILLPVDPNSFTVMERPTICYGGISPTFVHAKATEEYLQGKTINASTLQGALTLLGEEINPEDTPPDPSPEYRRGLAQSYFYRCLLSLRGSTVNPRLRSGAEEIPRENIRGQQVYDSDRSKWPLNQPVPKLESLPQTSGEAEYINDIRAELDELFGVFIVSDVANATIKSIDASQALLIPGVVAFITAEHIPGNNNFAPFHNEPEEIFADKRVLCAGQAIGLLVARDKYTAFGARSMVNVQYDDIRKPVLNIKDVATLGLEKVCKVKPQDQNFAMRCRGINAQTARSMVWNAANNRPSNIKAEEVTGNIHQVKGEFQTHAQYHFHLETQITICVPNEDGMTVYSSTQHMDSTQAAIAGCLNVPVNSITIHVRRLGGAFGAKISKANHVACAAAVAAHVTHKPVRIAMDLETNMQMIGKRLPYLVKYDVKVDDDGKIMKLDSEVWCDPGRIANEPTSLYGMICFQSCYRANSWNVQPKVALTDTPVNTYCRAPGSAQGVAGIEHIMEHIAYVVKKDPLEVRQINLMKKGDPFIGVPGARLPLDNLIPGMLAELKIAGDYESRKRYIEAFNQSNRWKKRGISIVPQRYPNYYPDLKFPTFISVYHMDGTVNVSHGGIEMGQGINTKVAQVVAHTLQIPLDKVQVKPSNTIISPNAGISGASVTSELVCSSARRACEELLDRLKPIREQLGKTATWEQIIAAANAREILLASQFQEMQGDLVSYDVWGIAMTEMEIDVLTGDYKIIRSDIIEDAGQSLSPLVDIGQIEGAFVMGLGWWLTEELIYDKDTGKLLTDGTWHYKPMLPADIPEDFRITMLRNAPNPFGVLSSKATGESPFNMSIVALFALRNAIDAARKEVGNNEWYKLDGAVSREKVRSMCLTMPDQFSF